jgi:alginate O-acetyltransferase complex protein AlgI
VVFSSHIFIFYFLPLALPRYYALAARRKMAHFWLILPATHSTAGRAAVHRADVRPTSIDWIMSLYRHDRGLLDVLGNVVAAPLAARSAATHTRSRIERDAAPFSGHDRARNGSPVTASVVSNLVVLGFFKYFNFGVDSYNSAVAALGFDAAQWDTFFRVVLPLGISFYTFQALSYTDRRLPRRSGGDDQLRRLSRASFRCSRISLRGRS